MMLPEGRGLHPGHGKLGGYIRFFNLSTGAFVRAKLPLFRNHCILDSVDGLLLLQRDQDTAIRLLRPFTGDIADLPPLATLPRLPGVHYHMKDTCSYFRSVSATSFSVSADGVISVVIAISVSLLAFATSRDQQWHLGGCRLSGVWRPISFQGKLYMLHNPIPTHPSNPGKMQIFQVDPPQLDGMGLALSPLPPPKLIATCPTHKKTHAPFYLAECDSEILLIGYSGALFRHILVYKLSDLILDRVVPLTSIGNNVILIDERTLSVSRKVLPSIVGDSIVTMHPMEVYLGQYHLITGTWSPAADGCITNYGAELGPYSLIYHVFTCCHRASWNKGAIRFQVKGQLLWKVKRKWRCGA